MRTLFNGLSNERLAFNRPPLKQVIADIVHLCEQQEEVYLHCEKMPVSDRSVQLYRCLA